MNRLENNALAFPNKHFLVAATRFRFYALQGDEHRVKSRNLFNFNRAGSICGALLIDSDIVIVADGEIIYIDTVGGPNAPRELLWAPGEVSPLRYLCRKVNNTQASTFQKIVFSPVTRTLFFTMSVTWAVQRLHLPSDTILEPGPHHQSPAICFAVSSFEQFLVSVDEGDVRHGPRFKFSLLQCATNSEERRQMAVRAARGLVYVDCMAFSPMEAGRDREALFAVCLRTGRVCLCDLRRALGGNPDIQLCEIQLHRISRRSNRLTITGAAWIPVNDPPLVTSGGDGWVRVTAFGAPPLIISEFNLRDPIKALAVTVIKTDMTRETSSQSESFLRAVRIALGFNRGRIVICDGLGQLLSNFPEGTDSAGIVDLAWKKEDRLEPGTSLEPATLIEAVLPPQSRDFLDSSTLVGPADLPNLTLAQNISPTQPTSSIPISTEPTITGSIALGPNISTPTAPRPFKPKSTVAKPATPKATALEPSASQPSASQPSAPITSTPITSTPKPSTPKSTVPQPSTPKASAPPPAALKVAITTAPDPHQEHTQQTPLRPAHTRDLMECPICDTLRANVKALEQQNAELKKRLESGPVSLSRRQRIMKKVRAMFGR